MRRVSASIQSGVVPFELVAELDLFGLDQADAGKVDLDVLQARRDGHPVPDVDRFSFDRRRFDHDRGRQRVVGFVLRLDDDDAVLGRKPEAPVLIVNARRLAAAVAFGRQHSVLRAVADAVDSGDLAVGEVVQFLPLDAVDAAIRADPEVAARVLFNREHAVVEEAVFGLVADEPAVLEAAQSLVVGADPQRAVGVFVDRSDVAADQPLLGRVVGELAVLYRDRPPKPPNQRVPLESSKIERHELVRQAVLDRERGYIAGYPGSAESPCWWPPRRCRADRRGSRTRGGPWPRRACGRRRSRPGRCRRSGRPTSGRAASSHSDCTDAVSSCQVSSGGALASAGFRSSGANRPFS